MQQPKVNSYKNRLNKLKLLRKKKNNPKTCPMYIGKTKRKENNYKSY